MKTIISQWNNLMRQKLYVILCIVLYIFLALYDNRNGFFIVDLDGQIYRHIFQQLVIVFANIILTMCVINEQFFIVYENMLKLYLKNEKQFYLYLMLMLYGATIIPFLIGQGLYLGLSMWMGNFISMKLWLVNIAVVMCEILITLNLSAALNLFLKKDILVYITYYLMVFTMMVTGNVYVTLPLTMSVLGTEGYYYSFDAPLWIGRCILLALSTGLVYTGAVFFLDKKHDEKIEKQFGTDIKN